MVCHETYKDKNGKWLSPDEVKKYENNKFKKLSDQTEVIVNISGVDVKVQKKLLIQKV